MTPATTHGEKKGQVRKAGKRNMGQQPSGIVGGESPRRYDSKSRIMDC